MEPILALPRQRTNAPILMVSILLGLLLSPVLERALEYWMPATATATDAQQRVPGNNSGNSSAWDLRAMWD